MSLTFDTFEALQPILQCIPHMIFAIDVCMYEYKSIDRIVIKVVRIAGVA